jgi:hypothetical protein
MRKYNVIEQIEDRTTIYTEFISMLPIPAAKIWFQRNRYKVLEGYDNSQLISITTKDRRFGKEFAIQSKSLDAILKKRPKRQIIISDSGHSARSK